MMTVIAALRINGQTWGLADRLVSWGDFIRADMAQPGKLVRYQNALIGSSGRALLGDALAIIAETKASLYAHPFEKIADVFRFFESYHKFLKDHYGLGGASENDVALMTNGSFLVLTADRIFEVSNSRDITEFNNYTAIGSGAELAIGAIHALLPVLDNPEEILRRAYEAAASHRGSVGGEPDLLNVTALLTGPAAQGKSGKARGIGRTGTALSKVQKKSLAKKTEKTAKKKA